MGWGGVRGRVCYLLSDATRTVMGRRACPRFTGCAVVIAPYSGTYLPSTPLWMTVQLGWSAGRPMGLGDQG